jgi:hypothetical protein
MSATLMKVTMTTTAAAAAAAAVATKVTMTTAAKVIPVVDDSGYGLLQTGRYKLIS